MGQFMRTRTLEGEDSVTNLEDGTRQKIREERKMLTP
jgi:hypothetical protein